MSRPTRGHTATYRGRRVVLKLVDDSVLAGRFIERTPSGFVVLDTGRVHKGLIHQFLLLRGGKSRPGG